MDTTSSANQLVDATATFITDGIETGDRVINTTDSTIATVTNINSETQLTLSTDIFASGNSYSINRDKNLSNLIDFDAPGWLSNSVTVITGVTLLEYDTNGY